MKQRSWLLVAALCILSTLMFAQSIDWMRGHDFSQYRTYAWGQALHPVQNSGANEAIVAAADQALQAKGLRRVETGSDPDLLVVASAGVTGGASIQGYRIPRFGSSKGMEETVQKDTTLVVDVADTESKTVIWRGVASGLLAEKSAAKTDRMQKTVTNMFKSFPPK